MPTLPLQKCRPLLMCVLDLVYLTIQIDTHYNLVTSACDLYILLLLLLLSCYKLCDLIPETWFRRCRT